MPEYYRETVIGLLGEWPEGDRDSLKKRMKSYTCFKPSFVGSVRPGSSMMLPDGFERMKEAEYAHEICIASKCDIVVYGNSGIWGPIKKKHIERLQREAVIILWTPPSVSDDIPDSGDIVPGIVIADGRINLVACLLAYLSTGNRTGGSELRTIKDFEEDPDPEEGWDG